MRRSWTFLLGMFFLGMITELALAQPATRKPGDGRADGKQSVGGSGEMIEFTLPREPAKIAGLRIHGSRYGTPQAPDESFLIYFLDQDGKRILHTEMAPYSSFESGPEKWVTISFDHPVDLPGRSGSRSTFEPPSARACMSATTRAPAASTRASGCPVLPPRNQNSAATG